MELNQKTVLVTGYNGFIGGKICEVLLAKGWAIVGIDNYSDSVLNTNITSYKCDILNKVDISGVMIKHMPSIIIHLAGGPAGRSGYENYSECFQINHQGSLNVIDAALKLPNLRKFIFMGSCEEYGSIGVPFKESAREIPSTAYGLAKLSVTHLLQALWITHNFPSVILRPSVVYGPGQKRKMFILDLIDHLLKDQEFDMSEGDQTRDFIYIDDLIKAITLAIKRSDISGEIINVSSCSPVSIKDLAFNIAAQFDNSANELIHYGAKNYRLGEQMKYYADNSKAEALLGWTPKTSLSEGIRRTIEWKKIEITSGTIET
jgi:nucleoside-diphosphate-sugar epimerase